MTTKTDHGTERIRVVKIVRHKSTGLGLSIKGGAEHGLPVLVSSLVRNGAADETGQIYVGDAILEVNGNPISPTVTTHDEALRLLKNAGAEVKIAVKHYKALTPFLRKSWKKKSLANESSLLNNNNDNKSNSGSSASSSSSGSCTTATDSPIVGGFAASPATMNGLHAMTAKANGNHVHNNNANGDIHRTVTANGNPKLRLKTAKPSSVASSTSSAMERTDVVSVPLLCCYLTRYVHDSDKVRSNGFEIRWPTVIPGHEPSPPAGRNNGMNGTNGISYTNGGYKGSVVAGNCQRQLTMQPSAITNELDVFIMEHNNHTTANNIHRNHSDGRLSSNNNDLRQISSAVIQCNDATIYHEWMSDIEANIHKVTLKQMKLLNGNLLAHEQILYMGWVCQGTASMKQESRPCSRWSAKYVVIKGGDLLMYTFPPKYILTELHDDNETEIVRDSNSGHIGSNNDKQLQQKQRHQQQQERLKEHQYQHLHLHPQQVQVHQQVHRKSKRRSNGSNDDDRPPDDQEDDDEPVEVYKAYQSVLRCLKGNELVDERLNCFLLLTADGSNAPRKLNPLCARHSCYLCAETSAELMKIKLAWNKATYYSVTQLGSKTFSVTHEGRPGSLTLDWKMGFAYYDLSDKEYKWMYRFSQLKNSSDDGCNTLWLTFQPAAGSSSSSSSPNKSSSSISTATTSAATKPTLSTMSTAGLRNGIGGGCTDIRSGNGKISTELPSKQTLLTNGSSSETRELVCAHLQNLIYCMHSFLSAKVSSVDPTFLQSS